MSDAAHTAYLSSEGRYTIFRFGDERLKIIAPPPLERYNRIVEWNHGYIAVMTRYAHNSSDIEEYIDLVSTLEHLRYDVDAFLKPIENVEVRYV